MVVRPIWVRRCAAMFISTLLLCGGMACHKSSSAVPANSFQISGQVTYTRVPLHYDAAGVPTGLETDTSLYITNAPARAVTLRVFQLRPQTNPDYSTSYAWTQVASAVTDEYGDYSVAQGVLQGYRTFVELVSFTAQSASPNSVISIIADPDGVYSSRLILDRPIYAMRRGIDGSTVSDPTQVPVGETDMTLNFALGLTDSWQVVSPRWWQPATGALATPYTPVNAGSSIMAILDSCYYFNTIYGNAVPTATAGELDLHYRPGLSTKRGAFVEYNPLTFPNAFDGTTYHYFGALNGGGTVGGVTQSDDAFDVGVIFPLLSRNHMFGERKTAMIPTGIPETSLTPDLAVIEGFGDAMGATILQSPYLPGNTPGNRYATPRDIRDLSALSAAQVGPFSAPALTALTWDLALINSNITAPGTPAQWTGITATNLNRFYALLNPQMYSGNSVINTDCVSIYTQLARLQEYATSSDTSNLANFFPDTTLVTVGTQFNVPWTTAANAVLPQYTTNWGIDPNTTVYPFPSFKLTMSQAQQINGYALDASGVEQATPYYPNNSKGEVLYGMFALSLDAQYNLTVTTVPALPAGVSIEVVVDSDLGKAYLFPAGTTPSYPLLLQGNPTDVTTPAWHTVRLRFLSPATLVPDTQVTLQLAKVN